MKLPAFALALITFAIPSSMAYAQANAVALNTVITDDSLHSNSMRISPASMAAMMRQIHYTRESFFANHAVARVFHKNEIPDLSDEISAVASDLKSQQAIAFQTEGIRVSGYVLLSGRQATWHITNIDGRPADRITNLTEKNASIDDPESIFENRIEESYWQFSPQQGQSLYQGKPDWLLVPVQHVSSPQSIRQHRPATVKSVSARSQTDSSHLGRIKILYRLLSKGLITATDYKWKTAAIIAEYDSLNPSIEKRLALLLKLKENGWIDKDDYQTRKQTLLKAL